MKLTGKNRIRRVLLQAYARGMRDARMELEAVDNGNNKFPRKYWAYLRMNAVREIMAQPQKS